MAMPVKAREERLAELLVHWEDARAGGTAPRPETFCQAHDCADLLDDFREMLACFDSLRFEETGSDGRFEAEPVDFQMGRFQARSEIGRGGLGVVYLAHDSELDRNIALKRLQFRAVADSSARERFVFEAKVTGRLEHPGVVPVYGFVTDAEGNTSYAMRLIEGETMRAAIDRFHDPNGPPRDSSDRNVELRKLLQSFVAACETVAYAHSRGVVHRDLKPLNIMLGSYGETLVIDWGLAKLASEAACGLAQGRAMGTRGYMSPEQARGDWDAVGPASDIFSLGATLFVILTGSTDRLAKVAVSKPLDAICQKAMAESPTDRYADARDLARDVERWLADEPISAYREPFSLRGRRWLKRNRVLASSAVVALAVAVPLLSAFLVKIHHKNTQLNNANSQVTKSLRETREHLDQNLQLLEEHLALAVRPENLKAIESNPERIAFLDRTADQVDRLRSEMPKNDRVRRLAILTHTLRASADPAKGLPDSVAHHLDLAEANNAELSAAAPEDPNSSWWGGLVKYERGLRLAMAERFDDARRELQSAHSSLVKALRANPALPAGAYFTAASACLELWRICNRTGQPSAADWLTVMNETDAVLAGMPVAEKNSPVWRIQRAKLRTDESATLGALNRFNETLTAADRGLAEMDGLAVTEQSSPRNAEVRAMLLLNRSIALVTLGRTREAFQSLSEAHSLLSPHTKTDAAWLQMPNLPDMIELGLIGASTDYLAILKAHETAEAHRVIDLALAVLDDRGKRTHTLDAQQFEDEQRRKLLAVRAALGK